VIGSGWVGWPTQTRAGSAKPCPNGPVGPNGQMGQISFGQMI
jgi:hypothetical protein